MTQTSTPRERDAAMQSLRIRIHRDLYMRLLLVKIHRGKAMSQSVEEALEKYLPEEERDLEEP